MAKGALQKAVEGLFRSLGQPPEESLVEYLLSLLSDEDVSDSDNIIEHLSSTLGGFIPAFGDLPQAEQVRTAPPASPWADPHRPVHPCARMARLRRRPMRILIAHVCCGGPGRAHRFVSL